METVERNEIIELKDKLKAHKEWLEHLEDLIFETHSAIENNVHMSDFGKELAGARKHFYSKMENL